MTPTRWQAVKGVYHAALDRPPADRAAYLAEACKGDSELSREVESLLAQDASKAGALDQPVWVGLVSSTDDSVNTIAPGAQLGPYKIEASLAEGGMGEVFRGVDTRLGRSVAVKTSREQFSARFEREARAISALNHPNICTLYDVGPNYLVMELCEGETLAARLERGRLSLEDTVRYGAQIADALAAAHAKGIVHRDLKPGNVMLTKAGVKVLDFGLAKSAQDETLTASQVVMGTPAYMAPEQREGKECDPRTDIYALGLILYEMASGRRWQPEQPPTLDAFPVTFAHVVARCLEGDPEDRWQSARDIRQELEWAATSRTDSQTTTAPGRINFMPWAVAAALAVGLASVATLHFREKPPAPVVPVRFQIPAPEDATLGALLKLSPDGRKLAFVAGGRLWVHSLESGESRDLTAASGTPFWSPNSRFIGYPSQGTLKKIEATGGPSQTVTDYHSLWGGGAWSQDDVILLSDRLVGLYRVPASGGIPVQLTALDRAHQEVAHAFPSFLPDGRHFFYTRLSRNERNGTICLGSLDEKPEQRTSKPLVSSNGQPQYAPSATQGIGYLLFVREGTLMAQPFDNRRLKLTGQVAPVAEHVADYRAFSASANDVLVFQRSEADLQLTWYDRAGRVLGTAGDPGDYQSVALSPDGRRLAVSRRSGQGANIWLMGLSGTVSRLTFGSERDIFPVWSPDGSRIVFSSNRDGPYNLYQKLANGAEDAEVMLKSSEDKFPTSWSRDGRFLLYTVVHPKTKSDIWVLPLDNDKKPVPFLITEFNEEQAHFSADGHWVAYTSDESGRFVVYVRSFSMAIPGAVPEAGGKWQVSTGYGREPRWRGDGRELYYLSLPDYESVPAGRAMSVGIATDPAFRAEKPEPVGILPLVNAWDSSFDAQRFVASVTKDGPHPYTVVLNWQAGLKK